MSREKSYIMTQLDGNNHSVFSLDYHLILIIKYRREVITDVISEYLRHIFKAISFRRRKPARKGYRRPAWSSVLQRHIECHPVLGKHRIGEDGLGILEEDLQLPVAVAR